MNEVVKKKLSQKRFLFVSGFLVLLISAALVFIVFKQKQKSDPASEKIIRRIAAKQLDKNPDELTDEDFAQITKLNIFPVDIPLMDNSPITPLYLSDINLLEKFVNLQEIGFTMVRYPQERIPKWMKFLASHDVIDLSDRFYIDLKTS